MHKKSAARVPQEGHTSTVACPVRLVFVSVRLTANVSVKPSGSVGFPDASTGLTTRFVVFLPHTKDVKSYLAEIKESTVSGLKLNDDVSFSLGVHLLAC